MNLKNFTIIILLGIVSANLTGCASMQQRPNTAIGAGTGAAIGGGLGAMAGHNIEGISTTEGAVAGALVGGLVGGLLGHQSDQMNQMQAQNQAQLNTQQQQIIAAQQAANTVIVNIDNGNGSITPVYLVRQPNGQYIGPKGEYYANLPTPDQLRMGGYGL